MNEYIKSILQEKIAAVVQNYRKRKQENPSSFNDVIGPDVMLTLSSKEQLIIIKMLNTYDKLKK